MRKTKRLSDRIAERRKKLGQSREDLALHWDKALSTIRNWEVGLSEPSGEDLARVERWLAEGNGRSGGK